MTTIVDLFCGAGGCSAGYEEAGIEAVGVDIKPQPNYPYEFAQADALHALRVLVAGGRLGQRRLEDFDAIHASPPCQSFSAYRRKGYGVGDGALNLIPETRELLISTGLPYVIENIPGAPLRDPITLCGSMFDLDVRRHRLFESNVEVGYPPPCDHAAQAPRFAPATNRSNLRRTVEVGVWRIPLETQREAMGVDWMTLEELSQAIPPAYTEWIGRRLLERL